MTNALRDERVAAYVAECGMEGYGFYWGLLEVVGSKIDKTATVATATYPLTSWSRMLYSHHHRVSKYLGKLGGSGLVTVEYVGSDIRVTIPKMLKYRDEYQRKSGQNTAIDTDTETETDVSANADTKKAAGKPRRRKELQFVSEQQRQAFDAWWDGFWRKSHKKAAREAYIRRVTTTGMARKVMDAMNTQKPGQLSKPEEFRPTGGAWLNGERHLDEIADLLPPAPLEVPLWRKELLARPLEEN